MSWQATALKLAAAVAALRKVRRVMRCPDGSRGSDIELNLTFQTLEVYTSKFTP
jgi:hypothetical protein